MNTPPPGFVDLAATLRLPRAPDEESAAALAAAARAGGFGVVVVAARGGEAVDEASLAGFRRVLDEAGADPLLLVPALAPLVVTAAGAEVADVASMVRTLPRDLPRVFRLRSAVDDALLLRRVGDLARGLSAVVIVPPHDAALMRGAVAVEGATATRLGLPAVPEASEAIAVARIVEVARLTGARFHIAGVFTAAGAALVEAHKDLVTGSVFASHLLLDESALLAHRYDTRFLARPPLPSSSSRQALLAAVKRGALCVSSGHHSVPKRERDLEMTRATPGLSSLSSLASLLSTSASTALSTAELQTALSTTPARVLGIAAVPPQGRPTAADDDLHRLLQTRETRP